MRFLERDRGRPLPRPRVEPSEVIDRLERELALAAGEVRATRDALCSWLESTADGHDADARHEKTPETRRLVHRMVAADLRQAAIDVKAVAG